MNANQQPLEKLVGRSVKALREFSGIPKGTVGMVTEVYNLGRKHSGVTVEWTTTGGYKVKDGFGRDAHFDETQWLEVVEPVDSGEQADPAHDPATNDGPVTDGSVE